jgi:hypothetical protein
MRCADVASWKATHVTYRSRAHLEGIAGNAVRILLGNICRQPAFLLPHYVQWHREVFVPVMECMSKDVPRLNQFLYSERPPPEARAIKALLNERLSQSSSVKRSESCCSLTSGIRKSHSR